MIFPIQTSNMNDKRGKEGSALNTIVMSVYMQFVILNNCNSINKPDQGEIQH